MSALPASREQIALLLKEKEQELVSQLVNGGRIIPFPVRKRGVRIVQAQGDPALVRASVQDLNAALKAAFEEEARRH